MKLQTKAIMLLAMCVVALSVTACGRKPQPPKPNSMSCVGMADNLNTVRVGDELPRVVQVLGMPTKAVRVRRVIGGSFDVLEYKMAPNPCLQAVLLVDEKSTLYVLFDSKGRFVETRGVEPYGFLKGFVFSKTSLILDSTVLNP